MKLWALTLACALLLSPVSALGQGVGAKYGARDPITCSSKKDPAKGPPSAEQARRYVQCGLEYERGGNTLNLAEDIEVEVAQQGRRFNPGMETAPEIDPAFPIYNLRGRYTSFVCGIEYKDPSYVLFNAGKNCTKFVVPATTGSCWKTTFGDWRCHLGFSNYESTANVPPPGRR